MESIRHRFSLRIGGSGLVAPIVYLADIFKPSPSLVYVHGLDLIVDNSFYQSLFLPFIRKSTHILANILNTQSLAINKGIDAANITVINPGVDIIIDPPNLGADSTALEQRFQLHNRRVLLSVGLLVKRKGLAEFVEQSLP